MARWLVALVLLGWGQCVFASTISYWRFLPYGSSQYTQGKYSSAKAACESYNPNSLATYRVSNQTSTQAWCYRAIYSSEAHVGYAHLTSETCQFGNTGNTCNTSCPAPGQMVDGQCVTPEPEENECEGKLGQQVSWDSSGVVYEGCVDNCSVALTGSSFSDTNSRRAYKADVTEDVLFRNTGLYTGESCGGASAPIQTVDIPPTEFQSDDECSATVTDSEGRKLSSCTQTDIYKDQRACVQAGGALGTTDTGSGSMLTCVRSKGPTASKTTTETKVTTEPKADGGTKTTTETTTTTKNCIGTNSCTTSTTTTTNVSNTNADGTKGGESSTCKGDKCASDGKSNEGKEDEKDDKEEEQEGIEGPSDSLAKGEQGDFSEGISEWDQKIQGARDDLTQKIDQLSGQFSGVFDLNLGGGAGSLPCETVHVSFGDFGSTNLNLCLAAYDQYLGYLRYILLLAAAVLAAFIIMRN